MPTTPFDSAAFTATEKPFLLLVFLLYDRKSDDVGLPGAIHVTFLPSGSLRTEDMELIFTSAESFHPYFSAPVEPTDCSFILIARG